MFFIKKTRNIFFIIRNSLIFRKQKTILFSENNLIQALTIPENFIILFKRPWYIIIIIFNLGTPKSLES